MLLGVVYFYLVLLSFTEINQVLPSVTGFYLDLLGFTMIYLYYVVLPSCTEFFYCTFSLL